MSQINSLPREWRGDSATPEIEAQRARVGDAEEGGGAGESVDAFGRNSTSTPASLSHLRHHLRGREDSAAEVTAAAASAENDGEE